MVELIGDRIHGLVFVWARAVGLTALLPIGMTGGFFLKFLIALMLTAPVPPVSSAAISWPGIGFEIVLGIALSLPLLAAHQLCGLLGGALDALRGETIGSIFDPQRNEAVSTYSALFSEFSWAALLLVGALDQSVAVFYRSLDFAPLGQKTFSGIIALLKRELPLFADLAGPCVNILLASAIIFLTVEAAFALIQKFFPRLQLDKEIFLLKTALGFLILKAVVDFGAVEKFFGAAARLPVVFSGFRA